MTKNQKDESSDAQGSGEVIDLEAYTQSDKTPPVGRKYRVKIGSEYFIFDNHIVTGKEILTMAGQTPVECHTLYQKFKNCNFEKIDLNERIDLTKPGIEHFVIKPAEVFYYTVDDEPETTDQKFLTPNQILELAGLKPPSDYYLVQKNPDGTEISFKGKPNELIKMLCPAIKFVSIYNGETPVS